MVVLKVNYCTYWRVIYDMHYSVNGKLLWKPRHSSCTANNIIVEAGTIRMRELKVTKCLSGVTWHFPNAFHGMTFRNVEFVTQKFETKSTNNKARNLEQIQL